MPYIYSTLSNDQDYALYPNKSDPKGIPQIVKTVHVKGKANIIDKTTFVTPKGVVSEVTEEELKVLEKIQAFRDHKKAGFIKVDANEADPKKVAAADLEPKDRSAQLVAGDFEPDKAPIVNAEPDEGAQDA